MTDHPQNKIEQALQDQFGITNVTLHYGLSQDELFLQRLKTIGDVSFLKVALMNKRLTKPL